MPMWRDASKATTSSNRVHSRRNHQWDIRPQMHIHGVGDQLRKRSSKYLGLRSKIERHTGHPSSAEREHSARCIVSTCPGSKALTCANSVSRTNRILERQRYSASAVEIRANLRQQGQQRLGLRRKEQRAVLLRIVERLDPETISRGKQPPLFSRPRSQGKMRTISPQMRNTIVTPYVIGGKDHLGI